MAHKTSVNTVVLSPNALSAVWSCCTGEMHDFSNSKPVKQSTDDSGTRVSTVRLNNNNPTPVFGDQTQCLVTVFGYQTLCFVQIMKKTAKL